MRRPRSGLKVPHANPPQHREANGKPAQHRSCRNCFVEDLAGWVPEPLGNLLGDPSEGNQQRREKKECALIRTVKRLFVLRRFPLAAAACSSESASFHDRQAVNAASLHEKQLRASLPAAAGLGEPANLTTTLRLHSRAVGGHGSAERALSRGARTIRTPCG